MSLAEIPTTQELKELAAKYPDVEITHEDSGNAGNCEIGTNEFIDEYFEGRDSVKVSELVEHIDEFSGVQRVLTYKFRILEGVEPNLDEHPF